MPLTSNGHSEKKSRHRRQFHKQTQARRGYGAKMMHAGPTTQDSRGLHQRGLLMQHPRYDKKEVNHTYLKCYHPDTGGRGNLTNCSGKLRLAGSAPKNLTENGDPIPT